jgi:hypothetical protein
MTSTTLPEAFDVKLRVDTADLRYLEIYDDFKVSEQASEEDTWLVTAKDRDFNLRVGIVSMPSQALAKLACSLLSECSHFYHAAMEGEVKA